MANPVYDYDQFAPQLTAALEKFTISKDAMIDVRTALAPYFSDSLFVFQSVGYYPALWDAEFNVLHGGRGRGIKPRSQSLNYRVRHTEIKISCRLDQ